MKFRIFILTLILALGVFQVLAQDGTTNSIQFNGIGFSFNSSLATNVNITQHPGDPTDLQQPGGPEARHIQFNLYSQAPAPESFFDAPLAIRVYRVADLSAYEGSLAQVTTLQNLLATRPDLASFMTTTDNLSDITLPFLPVAPAGQVIRAQANYVDTPTLSGVSYITVYRQDASPFVNNEFFYTFQGISTDGVYYASAVMQLIVPDFPAEIPADFDYDAFIAGITDYLNESITTLNAAAPEAFTPPLTALDNLVQTITFTPTGGQPPVETPVVEPTVSDPTFGGLAGKIWTLVSYGSPDAPTAVLSQAPITVIFSEQGVAGTGGCNSYSGTFAYNENTLTFENIISTLMACEEPINTQEAAYFAALASANSFTITDNTLQIFYDGGVLTFTGTPSP